MLACRHRLLILLQHDILELVIHMKCPLSHLGPLVVWMCVPDPPVYLPASKCVLCCCFCS